MKIIITENQLKILIVEDKSIIDVFKSAINKNFNDIGAEIVKMKIVYDQIKTMGSQYYSTESLKSDAFRHILASAYFTTKLGSEITKGLGDLNEFAGYLRHPFENLKRLITKQPLIDSGKKMDDINNKIGVIIGKKNMEKDLNGLASQVKKTIDNGNFYVEDGVTLFKNIPVNTKK